MNDIKEQNDFIGFEESEQESEEQEIINEATTPIQLGLDLNQTFLSVDPLYPLPIPPWVSPNRELDEEIIDYVEYVKPTKAEHTMRLFTLERLEKVVKSTWPKSKLECFGSFDTQLYLPSSDLDCVITESSLETPRCLYILQDELNSAGIASRIDVIAKSKVPIIKYVDSITHFSLDVSFNMNNGVEAAKVVKTFVNDPKIGKAIFHLMLLLKQFLAQRHLNEVFTGGLGSYALLCMIASFLKIHPLIVSGEINPMENLGILLIEFFELYGKNFNYQEVGISVTIGNATYYKRDPYEFRPGIVSIRDPQDQSNDVSSGSYNFLQIKWAFARAFSALTSMIGAGYERKLGNIEDRKHFVNEILDDSNANDSYMITLLGGILSLNRSVLKQRDFIQLQYEKYLEGELVEGIYHDYYPPKPLELQKRKRDDDAEQDDVIYVDASSQDSEELPDFIAFDNDSDQDPIVKESKKHNPNRKFKRMRARRSKKKK